MYNVTRTTDRPPDPCPRDPDHIPVKKIVRDIEYIGKSGPTLTQYQCANGCGAPRGWMYRHTGRGFRHGPGECQDQDVLHEINVGQHYVNMMGAVGIIFAICLMVGSFAAIAFELAVEDTSRFSQYIPRIVGIGMTIPAAISMPVIWWGMKTRPKHPDRQA